MVRYKNKEELELKGRRLKNAFTITDFSDIEYLIISGKSGELEEIITFIRSLRITKIDQDTLITKILTTKQILNDF